MTLSMPVMPRPAPARVTVAVGLGLEVGADDAFARMHEHDGQREERDEDRRNRTSATIQSFSRRFRAGVLAPPSTTAGAETVRSSHAPLRRGPVILHTSLTLSVRPVCGRCRR